jgi:glycosyltransferase involved in cell wall biosynthesis
LIITLLGRRDSPTDAVADYCSLLNGAFGERGFDSVVDRVAWDESGWGRELWDLWKRSANWKGDWLLVQYTALMWSRRGFPVLFLVVLSLLKIRRARIALVFHDSQPYAGRRLVDRVRRVCQGFVMRWAYRLSDHSILNIPLKQASWPPPNSSKATFIPIPATIPAVDGPEPTGRNGNQVKTIALFCLTGGGDMSREVSDIALAARKAAERVPRVRLVTVGRGSLESESSLREALAGSAVEYDAFGILLANEVSQVLANADVSLFVRGPISTARSSAIASIASALPLVAYADGHLPAPLAEAGVVGVRYPDAEELADATVRVLTDPKLWRELHERSQQAYEAYFSWEAVASRFLNVLRVA